MSHGATEIKKDLDRRTGREVLEQPPEQKKVPRLRHGMEIKIGLETFKVIRPGKKKNVILKYIG